MLNPRLCKSGAAYRTPKFIRLVMVPIMAVIALSIFLVAFIEQTLTMLTVCGLGFILGLFVNIESG